MIHYFKVSVIVYSLKCQNTNLDKSNSLILINFNAHIFVFTSFNIYNVKD